jgi:phenylalanyl-tRNA synthetase beta chain
MVRNIKIAPSPLWMRRRLRASGVRPINNIVDITNYVMLEYGQPMHAFDYSCVNGGKIIVRRAAEGETLETLDGNARNLTTDMLVIADEGRPIGVAGVMGGGNSEIVDSTNMIVFESANFNGISVRRTGLGLGLRTDASGRYEKGLDPQNTMPAVERACELVELLGAGEVLPGCIDVIGTIPETLKLPLEVDRVNALLGTDIDEAFMIKTLTDLGFVVEDGVITVPSWRSDIEGYADIAEEVARFYGYDNIVPTDFKGVTAQGGYSDKQQVSRKISTLCRGMGYYEIITYSFGSRTAWDKVRVPEDSPLRRAFTILNPLGEDTSVMRTTPLPSMLDVLATNYAKRNTDVKLYELSTVYIPVEGQDLADERTVLTMGVYGKGADFLAVKGEVEAILSALRIKDVSFRADKTVGAYHPGRCAAVYSGETRLGIMGQVHPSVCEDYNIGTEVCTVELGLRELMDCRGAEPTYVPLPRFPAVTRDIAIVCDAAIPAYELQQCIMNNGGEYLESCALFDVYTGSHIPEGKKSVAFSLTMRAKDQTLTDDHAEETVSAVLEALEKIHGAVIR